MCAHFLNDVVANLFADESNGIGFQIVLCGITEVFEGEIKCQGVVEERLQAMMDGVWTKSDDDIIDFLWNAEVACGMLGSLNGLRH